MKETYTIEMTEPTKKLYNEAKNNKNFINDLTLVEEEHSIPLDSWDPKMKVLYASIYMGWKIAKGNYNVNDYYKKD